MMHRSQTAMKSKNDTDVPNNAITPDIWQEENQYIDLIGNACGEYERQSYIEGMDEGWGKADDRADGAIGLEAVR